MKREIKFRAWDKESSEMFCTNDVGTCYDMFFHFEKDVGLKLFMPIEEDFPEQRDSVIMQFVGFSDKNGKDIYEGDIVTFKRSIGNWTGQFITDTCEIVYDWECCRFALKYKSNIQKLRKHWGYEYEVIGNVFENTELLTGGYH